VFSELTLKLAAAWPAAICGEDVSNQHQMAPTLSFPG
jgi:hypothetical protein